MKPLAVVVDALDDQIPDTEGQPLTAVQGHWLTLATEGAECRYSRVGMHS